MSGHLYQLYPYQFRRLPTGSVKLDGVWDTYGVLVKPEIQENGTYLIRGTGRKDTREITSILERL